MEYSIYEIRCKDPSVKELYVGSTTNLKDRKTCHKKRCCNPLVKGGNYYVYEFIRKNGGWDNWDMIEVKKINVNSKLEARKEERKHIDEIGGSGLNQMKPYISEEERKEYYKKGSEWYQKNAERSNDRYRKKLELIKTLNNQVDELKEKLTKLSNYIVSNIDEKKLIALVQSDSDNDIWDIIEMHGNGK